MGKKTLNMDIKNEKKVYKPNITVQKIFGLSY